MKKNIFYSLLTSFLFLFLLPFSPLPVLAQSAEFSLKSDAGSVGLNEAFIAQVFLNTPQAEVNTVHLELEYSSPYLSLQEISFTDSVFPNIVEKDTSASNIIKLTAFTITPYKGNNGLIASLKFKSEGAGKADIDILSSSTIHLADGLGTDVFNHQSPPKKLNLTVSQAGVGGGVDEDVFSPPILPYDSPRVSDQDSEPTFLEAILAILKKPIDFIKEKFAPEAQTVSVDEEKEAIYFPENYDQVADYTKDRQTKFRKLANQGKGIGGELGKTIPKLFALLFVIIFVFIIVVVFIKVKEKRENIKPEQTNED